MVAFVQTQLDSLRGIMPTDLPDNVVVRSVARIASTIQALAHRVPLLNDVMKSPQGRRSMVVAAAECARLNLVPNAGPMSPIYLIPRKRKFKDGNDWVEVYEVTAQLSVRGLTTLAQRQGYVIEYGLVYDGDRYEYRVTEHGTHFVHEPALDRPLLDPSTLAPLKGGWVQATPINGGPRITRVVGLHTILKRREASDAWKNVPIKDGKIVTPRSGDWKAESALKTPWVQWTDSMVAKALLAEALARHMIPLEEPIREAIERSDAHDYVIEPEEERPDPMGALRAAIAGPPVSDDVGDEDEPERRPEPAQAPQNESEEERYARLEEERYNRENPQPSLLGK
jgi:recombinational DNA repair protein RecT